MSFQYPGGTIVYADFLGDTRNNIVENSRTHFLNAGYTEPGSSVAGNRRYDSPTTAQSLKYRIRVYDPGSGNCARVAFMDQAEARVSGDFFLLPAASKNFTALFYRYQICIFVKQSTAARDFVMGGVPFLETFLTTGASAITEAIWAQGSGSSDIDTSAEDSFRTRGHARVSAKTWQTLNTTAWSSTAAGIGNQRLQVLIRGNAGDTSGLTNPTLWHNDYAAKFPARICWSPTSQTTDAEINGQLWGGAMIMKAYPMEDPATFDGHNWICLTASNITDYGQPSLFLAIT